MEPLICVAGLCLLSVLALRFGVDSRPRAYSPEEDYARLGMTWDPAQLHLIDLRREAAVWRMTQHVELTPRRQPAAWRRATARRLRALAAWLNPELGEPGAAYS
jgi:hypothetical protein